MRRAETEIPIPPKLPPTTSRFRTSTTAVRDICEDEVDVIVFSHCGGKIYAHANILARPSPVIKKLLKQSKKQSDGRRSIHIRGVPFEVVRVFLVFMYASCYDQQQMDDFVVHLLVLSHAYVLPHLKRVCESRIENDMLNIYNVIDIFQLAILCDASRLSLICHRIIIRNFKVVSKTDGWMAMKQAHPVLLKKILRSIPQIKMIHKLKMKKKNDRKMYVQLYKRPTN